jgi:Uncharacterised protein family (UPF0014)
MRSRTPNMHLAQQSTRLLADMLVQLCMGRQDPGAAAALVSTNHAVAAAICTDRCSVLVLACVQVRTKPWYEPQYFITILGMVLGNCISSISVGLSALLDDLTTGATSNNAWPWTAAILLLRERHAPLPSNVSSQAGGTTQAA